MVEVFKTNVEEPAESSLVISRLLVHFPQSRINFDLSDCDRILRVEGETICTDTITNLVNSIGYHCELL